MLISKNKLEQELSLSLDRVHSIKIKEWDRVGYSLCSFKDENGLNLVMESEFNLVSLETKRFLILMEVWLTEFGWDKLYYLSNLEFKEKIVEATLYAGGQANYYYPSKSAIEAINDYTQYLDYGDARDFDEILDYLKGLVY